MKNKTGVMMMAIGDNNDSDIDIRRNIILVEDTSYT